MELTYLFLVQTKSKWFFEGRQPTPNIIFTRLDVVIAKKHSKHCVFIIFNIDRLKRVLEGLSKISGVEYHFIINPYCKKRAFMFLFCCLFRALAHYYVALGLLDHCKCPQKDLSSKAVEILQYLHEEEEDKSAHLIEIRIPKSSDEKRFLGKSIL